MALGEDKPSDADGPDIGSDGLHLVVPTLAARRGRPVSVPSEAVSGA
jgi:hypothetical protein